MRLRVRQSFDGKTYLCRSTVPKPGTDLEMAGDAAPSRKERFEVKPGDRLGVMAFVLEDEDGRSGPR